MISQKNRIISRLEKYKIGYEIISDNLIIAFLLYIKANIVINGEVFRVEVEDKFVSKNWKKDVKRLKAVLKEKKVVNRMESLEYFEDKYGI